MAPSARMLQLSNAKDLAEHKAKPTNMEPGIEYMLEGPTDWSATDPYTTSGTPVKYPPHWMILWPFDPATQGCQRRRSGQGPGSCISIVCWRSQWKERCVSRGECIRSYPSLLEFCDCRLFWSSFCSSPFFKQARRTS